MSGAERQLADTLTCVRVRVRLFAGLRERAGAGSLEIDVPDGATIADVWPVLELGAEPAGLLYARNRAYVEPSEALVAGDEVAVIPPVSGGDFRLSADTLSVTPPSTRSATTPRARSRRSSGRPARSRAVAT
jgi:molybdopterin converting factor small subunit